METALATIILVSLMLMTGLSLAQMSLSTQEALLEASHILDQRVTERTRTRISTLAIESSESGETMQVVMVNSGEARLADLPQWDVIVQYHSTAGQYVIQRLPHRASADLGAHHWWDLGGIYLDRATDEPEAFDLGIVNPGEQILLILSLSPTMDPRPAMVTICTPQGVTTQGVVTPNIATSRLVSQ
ncbi:MAG: hypothetical protein ACYC5M_00730 [Anaerolineae bacterium]